MYASSSIQALIELFTWVYETGVSLPLFKLREEDPKSPKVCISIASTRRPDSPIPYLVQAVSALLNRMNYAAHKNDVYIHVFNVDEEPADHREVDIVKHLVPVSDLKILKEAPSDDFPLERHYHENMDNAAIIRFFDKLGCEFPIFLEDDALATNNWVESVMESVKELETRPRNSWFIVRLFVARSFYPPLWHRGISDYDPGFNNVAVLLNKEYMLDYASELEQIVQRTLEAKSHSLHLPKDLVAADFAKSRHLQMLAFEPVVFQHTGVYSSVTNRSLTSESATSWIMDSKYYDADNEPVKFDSNFWEARQD